MRHVKLFKNGRNQAVRIPRDMELPGVDAVIRREGEKLIIEPVARRTLLAVLANLKPLDEEMAQIDELPIDPVSL